MKNVDFRKRLFLHLMLYKRYFYNLKNYNFIPQNINAAWWLAQKLWLSQLQLLIDFSATLPRFFILSFSFHFNRRLLLSGALKSSF